MATSSSEETVPNIGGKLELIGRSSGLVLIKNGEDDFQILSNAEYNKIASTVDEHLYTKTTFADPKYKGTLKFNGPDAATDRRIYEYIYSGKKKRLFVYKLAGRWNFLTESAYKTIVSSMEKMNIFIANAATYDGSSGKELGNRKAHAGADSDRKMGSDNSHFENDQTDDGEHEAEHEKKEVYEITSSEESNDLISGSESDSEPEKKRVPVLGSKRSPRTPLPKARQIVYSVEEKEVRGSKKRQPMQKPPQSSSSTRYGSTYRSESPDMRHERTGRTPEYTDGGIIIYGHKNLVNSYAIVKRGEAHEIERVEELPDGCKSLNDKARGFGPRTDKFFLGIISEEVKKSPRKIKVFGCAAKWNGKSPALIFVLIKIRDQELREQLETRRENSGESYKGPLICCLSAFKTAFKDDQELLEKACKLLEKSKLYKDATNEEKMTLQDRFRKSEARRKTPQKTSTDMRVTKLEEMMQRLLDNNVAR